MKHSLSLSLLSFVALPLVFIVGMLGIVETVVLGKRVFVPCRKRLVLTKIGESSDIAFYPQKQVPLFLRPRKSTNMTKMAGVTQAT